MRLIQATLALLLLVACNSMAATITVTTLSDSGSQSDGSCSLREAITAASQNSAIDTCNAGQDSDDLILIDPLLISSDPTLFRIDLTAPLLPGGGNLTIEGPADQRLIISGDEPVQIMRVDMQPAVSRPEPSHFGGWRRPRNRD